MMWFYDVDLYIWGHIHWYGRQGPKYLREGEKKLDKPIMLVVGGSGSDEMWNHDSLQNVDRFKPNWYQDKRYYNYSVGYLTMSESQLKWELHDSESNEIVDSFTLHPNGYYTVVSPRCSTLVFFYLIFYFFFFSKESYHDWKYVIGKFCEVFLELFLT